MVLETVSEHSASALKLWTAVAIFLATYGIVLSEKINRAIVAVLGGGLMVLLGILTQDQAIASIDFNTIGLLLGMMIIVAITKDSGVFQYVAIKAAKMVKANPTGLIIVFALVTAVFSALLDNVTTVLLTTPVLLLITRELGVKPYPYLFASIIASNIGGSSTLIGDPTTVMIGSAANLSFNDFIFNVMPISAVLMLVSMVPILLLWKSDLVASDHNKERIMKLNEKEAIKDPVLLKKSAAVLITVIIGFIFGHSYDIMPATIAMTGAAFLLLLDNFKNDHEKQEHRVHHSIGEAEWITIFFFAGLFVVVHGLQGVGAIGFLADKLMDFTSGDFDTTVITILWGAAVLSALVDNIPFVATMIPMIESMSELNGFEDLQPLWWALALGACLGGSGSLVGSSANLVVAGFAARSGNAIGFLKYMAVAFPLMLVNVSIANVYVYFRYLAD
jgi:Na+/H+ antiporter NhaD/arsenite permease-like protein